MKRLENKIAVITGASTGIGKNSIVKRFHFSITFNLNCLVEE